MQDEWILDVLTDLRAFAQKNGLGLLAEQLDDTRLVAASELALMGEGKHADDGCPAIAAGPPFECVGERH